MTTNHDQTLKELEEQFRPILDNSPDGMYLWLDETHSICNERMAKMFGYTVREWRNKPPLMHQFVVPENQEMFAQHYQVSVGHLAYPVTFRFRGVRKDGTTFAAETDMVPITIHGHAVAYHFVRQIAE